MTTDTLRARYAKTARACVDKVNHIRRISGRSDIYTMREFAADTRDDIFRSSGSTDPTPEQWVFAARARLIELGR